MQTKLEQVYRDVKALQDENIALTEAIHRAYDELDTTHKRLEYVCNVVYKLEQKVLLGDK